MTNETKEIVIGGIYEIDYEQAKQDYEEHHRRNGSKLTIDSDWRNQWIVDKEVDGRFIVCQFKGFSINNPLTNFGGLTTKAFVRQIGYFDIYSYEYKALQAKQGKLKKALAGYDALSENWDEEILRADYLSSWIGASLESAIEKIEAEMQAIIDRDSWLLTDSE